VDAHTSSIHRGRFVPVRWMWKRPPCSARGVTRLASLSLQRLVLRRDFAQPGAASLSAAMRSCGTWLDVLARLPRDEVVLVVLNARPVHGGASRVRRAPKSALTA
jgi:hypothetical protein